VMLPGERRRRSCRARAVRASPSRARSIAARRAAATARARQAPRRAFRAPACARGACRRSRSCGGRRKYWCPVRALPAESARTLAFAQIRAPECRSAACPLG
jgi:hypothetical protein